MTFQGIKAERGAVNWVHRLTDSNDPLGRFFDRLIYVLIIASMILFAAETLPSARRYQTWFDWSEYLIVALFTAEYILRALSKRLRYMLGFYGLVDLLAILPFYVSLGAFDLRAVRMCRLLRLLRLAKLHRFGSAWRRLRAAFLDIKYELAVFSGFTMTMVYLASVGIYYCEHDAQPEAFQSIFHAMWWAIVTLTTVGYGDVYPITAAGRVFTFFVLILGLGIISVPSGLLASALIKRRENDERDADDARDDDRPKA